MSYRDKIYSKYISQHTAHILGKSSIVQSRCQFFVWHKYFDRFLPSDKKAKIIDLGCGNGSFVGWLQELGYSSVQGVDISAEQIQVAQKNGIKNIFQNDIKNFLEDKIAEYDIVFMRDVLEHFNKEEILNILELINKSLKKNGIIVIQTPNAESPLSGRFRYYDFTHEVSFTSGSIQQVLSVSGFNNMAIFSTPPVIHGVKSFVRYILWKFIELIIRLYLLVETGSSQGIFTQNLIAVAKK